MSEAAQSRALLRRLLRACSRVPVAYARRATEAHVRSLFRLYAAPHYAGARAELLAGAAADADALEAVLRLPRASLLLLFRKNAEAEAEAPPAASDGPP